MITPRLTICIPSFNRNTKIKKLIKDILKQLNLLKIKVNIIVLDNCSPRSYLKSFQKDKLILSAMKTGILEIHRNIANIGMSANFLKAFELTKSEWLWIVSDDDIIFPNAIKIIYEKLNSVAKKIGVIKFTQSNIKYLTKYKLIDSLEKFIDFNVISKHNFYDFIFISNSLYRVNSFRKNLNIGYQNSHTYIPHFFMITEFIKKGGSVLNLNTEVIKYQIPKISYSYGLVCGLGVGGIKYIDLNLNKNYEKKYYKIFYPYNDYKVLIDLFYLTKKKSIFNYEYYAQNYINYVSIARNPLQIMLLVMFIKIGNIKPLFNLLLKIALKISITFKIHHEEIKKKYSF
jgi:glycosyltransferase involved in cell wall biosynthesis